VLTVGCSFTVRIARFRPTTNGSIASEGERIAEEMRQLLSLRRHQFLGTDDNFFNNTQRTLEIAETLAQ
jgi:hypothetical protein